MLFQNSILDAGKWFTFLILRPRIPIERSVIWCGNGYQRFLIGFSSGQVGIGGKIKPIGPKRGLDYAWHSHQLSSVAENGGFLWAFALPTPTGLGAGPALLLCRFVPGAFLVAPSDPTTLLSRTF